MYGEVCLSRVGPGRPLGHGYSCFSRASKASVIWKLEHSVVFGLSLPVNGDDFVQTHIGQTCHLWDLLKAFYINEPDMLGQMWFQFNLSMCMPAVGGGQGDS